MTYKKTNMQPIDELCQCGHSKKCHGKTNLEDHGGQCNQCECGLYTWKEFIFISQNIQKENHNGEM